MSRRVNSQRSSHNNHAWRRSVVGEREREKEREKKKRVCAVRFMEWSERVGPTQGNVLSL